MNVFPKPNVFLISEVLENIFNQTEWSFQDLQNLRLVCKLWREVSLPLWRSTATLCLLQERRPTSRKTGILAKRFASNFVVDDEEDSFQLQLRKKPYLKYKLFNWKFGEMYFDDFKKLWDDIIGPQIRHLTLERCTYQGSDCTIPEHFMHMVYVGSPLLKHLSLNASDIETRFKTQFYNVLQTVSNPNIEYLEVKKMIPCSRFYKFLITLPNLNKLEMEELLENELYLHRNNPNPSVNARLPQIAEMNFLRRSLKKNDLPNLRHLDIMHWNISPYSDTDIVGPLERLQLPLESLTLSLTCVGVGQENDEFRRIVKAHATTLLKVLKVFVPPFYRAQRAFAEDGNGNMMTSKIEDLELWGNVVGDFDFLQGMPELKKLKMNYDCFEKRKYVEEVLEKEDQAVYIVCPRDFFANPWRRFRNTFRMEHLTEFSIDLKFGGEELEMFAKHMPNLKSFKSVFDSATFPKLLREWRNGNLEELHALYGSDLDDGAICGGSSRIQGRDLDYPNITWLKELRHFTLDTYCDVGELSDRSAEEGFLKIKLRSLKICVSSEFSREMEERLKESIALVQVVRNYGDHEGECCERMNFKKKIRRVCFSDNSLLE